MRLVFHGRGKFHHFPNSSQKLTLLGWLSIGVMSSECSSLHALRISAAFAALSGEVFKHNQGCDSNKPPFHVVVHLFPRIYHSVYIDHLGVVRNQSAREAKSRYWHVNRDVVRYRRDALYCDY